MLKTSIKNVPTSDFSRVGLNFKASRIKVEFLSHLKEDGFLIEKPIKICKKAGEGEFMFVFMKNEISHLIEV